MHFDNTNKVGMAADYNGTLDIKALKSRLHALTKEHDAFSFFTQQDAEVSDCNLLFQTEFIECKDESKLIALQRNMVDSSPSITKPLTLTVITCSPKRHWIYLSAPDCVADLYTLQMCLSELLEPSTSIKSEIAQFSEVQHWLESIAADPEAPELDELVEPSVLENNTKQHIRIKDWQATGNLGARSENVSLMSLKERLKLLSAQYDANLAEVVKAAITLVIKTFNTHAEVALLHGFREDDALKQVYGPLFAALPSDSSEATTLQQVIIEQKRNQELFSDIAECFYSPKQPAYLYTFHYLKGKPIEGLSNRYVSALRQGSEISFIFYENGDELSLQISYCSAMYSLQTINLIADRILSILSDEYKPIPEWEGHGVKISSPEVRLFEWLDQSSKAYADTRIIVPEQGAWSLAELHQQANKLGNYLVECGVTTGSKVVICQPRSIEFFTAMLALAKLGVTYVPLDESMPQKRLEAIVEQLQPELLITSRGACKGLKSQLIVDISQLNLTAFSSVLPHLEVSYSNNAYIIFTSGSTGQPKGIEISYEALENHMHWFQEEFAVGKNDVLLQKTSAGFDASIWEFWIVLLAGVNCVIAPSSALYDLDNFTTLLQKYKITLLQVVPSYLSLLMSHPKFHSGELNLRKLFCGGEVLRTSTAENARGKLNCEIVNLYGPTEACIDATYFVFTGNIKSETVPIGRPIGNLTCKVLDAQGQVQGVGGVGELLISGPSLFNGYFGSVEATQSAIYIDEKHYRYYRTGDIVSLSASGLLQYVGREDNQIKLNGFRIDLTSIGSLAESLPSVIKAECIFYPGENKLILVYQSESIVFDGENLRSFLTDHLPTYMVPERLVSIDEFPVTRNGKIDFTALSQFISQNNLSGYEAPTTDTQKALASIWRKILRRTDKIGIDDSFFSLGGDSILGIKVAYELNQQGIQVSLVTLFDNPTIRELATAIESSSDLNNPVKSSIEELAVPDALKNCYDDVYPVTGMQQFMLSRYEENMPRLGIFHPQEVLFLPASMADLNELQRALNVELHNYNFRTRFVEAEDATYQVIVPPVKADIKRIEVEDEGLLQQTISQVLAQDNQTPFDWRDVQRQLIRFYYLLLPSGDATVIMSNLHTIQDGWGNVVFKNNVFARLSKEAKTGITDILAKPNVLREYVLQERALLKSDDTLTSYWQDKAKHFQSSFWNGEISKEGQVESMVGHLPASQLESMRAASNKLRVHVKSLLLAALLTVLKNQLGPPWTTVGIVSNGRNPLLSEPLESMGLFWNLLPITLQSTSLLSDSVLDIHNELIDLEKVVRFPISEQIALHGGQLPFMATFNFVEFHHQQGIGNVRTPHLSEVESNLKQDSAFLGQDYFGFPVEFAFSVNQGQLSWVVHFHNQYVSEADCANILKSVFSLIEEI